MPSRILYHRRTFAFLAFVGIMNLSMEGYRYFMRIFFDQWVVFPTFSLAYATVLNLISFVVLLALATHLYRRNG